MANEPRINPNPPTREHPVKKSGSGITHGIRITVANLQPEAVNLVTADASFIGRAVLLPPGAVTGVDPDQYSFVAYVCPCMGAMALYVPNVSGILFADLPNGVLPPVGYDGTLFGAISDAIKEQISPTAPDGTGNGH